MGYMTVVSILNDGWDTIKQNPKTFIENIEKGMHGNYRGSDVQSFAVGNYANPMEVHRSVHADTYQLLLVGGNKMEDLNDFESRRDADFYLAYKIRAIRAAKHKLEVARISAMEHIASEIAKQVRLLPEYKTDSVENIHIQNVAESTEVFKLLSFAEQHEVYQKVKSLLLFK